MNQKFKFYIISILLMLVSSCAVISNPDSNISELDATESGTGIISTASSPDTMKSGDIIVYELDSENTEINLAGVDSSSKFILTFGNSSTNKSSDVELDHNVSPSSSSASSKSINLHNNYEKETDIDSIASYILRLNDVDLARNNEIASMSYNASTKSVSEIEAFYVVTELSYPYEYDITYAKKECSGEYVSIYVDTRVRYSELSDNDIAELCIDADIAIETVINLIGEPSDVNNDGRVTILLTPSINTVGFSHGGILSGYFYALDLFDTSNSNRQEIIYSLVPDPTGRFGTKISTSFALNNLIRSVIPHETQHLINYSKHVLERNSANEELWLNEGLSHLIEDLSGYNTGNPSRYRYFLNAPENSSLISSSEEFGIAERGATYLFLRYLYEQADDPDQFVWDLVNTNDTGIRTIENAFNGHNSNFDQFSEFLAHWHAALALSGRELDIENIYLYKDRQINTYTNNLHGVIINGDTKDGRGTKVSGVKLNDISNFGDFSLSKSSVIYFEIHDYNETINIVPNSLHDYAILMRIE